MPQAAVSLGWRPHQLLAGLTNALPTEECLIEHLALDAAECGPGTLFLAARGDTKERVHSAGRAAASGCLAIAFDPTIHASDDAALGQLIKGRGVRLIPVEHLESKTGVIAARFFGNPSSALNVIGVFGRRRAANVSHLIAQALAEHRCGLIGELGNGFLDELQDDGGGARTDPLLLQQRLARLRAAGARTVAAPCLPKTLPLAISEGLHLDTAVFAGDAEAGPDARAQVAALRRAAAQPGLRWAVINRDAPLSAPIEDALGSRTARACFSQHPQLPLADCDCWVRATGIAATTHGLLVELETSAGSGSVEVPLLGRSNVANLLAVIGMLLSTGRDLHSALSVTSRLQGVPGRLEPFTAPNSPLVVVDHADRPRTLLHAIRQLRGHRRGRLIVVFGCAGGTGQQKRPQMGAIAERHGDRVILTDDNPRTEDGDSIIDAILAGTSAPEQVVVERQRALAIRRAIALARIDDTVLIAGKGHATTQDMGELKVHFSDRAQVVQALSERRGSGL